MKFLSILIISICTMAGATLKKDNTAVKAPVKTKNDILVMVIDTGIAPHMHLQGLVEYDESDNYVDNHGHGTHVAGIIANGPNPVLRRPLCDNIKIISCKYFDPTAPKDNLNGTIDCVNKAIKLNVKYINYSGGGKALSFQEFEAFKKFDAMGGTAVVALGNESQDLTDETPYFPAMYAFGFKFKASNGKYVRSKPLKNMIAVGALCEESNERCKKFNKHPLSAKAPAINIFSTLPGNTYGAMTGTSQATPQILHFILRQKCEDIKNKVQQN